MAGVGPRIQLAAVGPQDVPLTVGTPAGTSPPWLQYSAFATAETEILFPAGLDFGGMAVVTVPPSLADVIGPVFLRVRLPQLAAGARWKDRVGLAMIRRLQVLAGDVLTDDTDGLQQRVFTAMHATLGQRRAVDALVGRGGLAGDREHTLFVPLGLFFTRPTGEGVPLIAMTQSKLQLTLQLDTLANLVDGAVAPQASLSGAALVVAATLLTPEERSSIMSKPYDLLVDRTLRQAFSTAVVTSNHDVLVRPSLTVDLGFMQGPVRQIVLLFRGADGRPTAELVDCALFVNNVQQGTTRKGEALLCPNCLADLPVYAIDFALDPSSQQPCGVLDMNQTTSCFLRLNVLGQAPTELTVYSVSHSVLRFSDNRVGYGDV